MAVKIAEYDVDWLKKQILEQGKTYAELGEVLGVSREWIRQICQKYGISLYQRKASWYANYAGKLELATPDWLFEMREKGYSLFQIAKKIGVSYGFLTNQIKRFGLNPKDFRRQSPTITRPCSYCGKLITRPSYKAKGKKFFCHHSCLGKWLAENYGFGPPWIIEEDEFLKENWQRLTDKALGVYLGRSRQAITAHRNYLGLKKRK